MFTNAKDRDAAWKQFLGREFKGLSKEAYEGQLAKVEDEELRKKALKSLSVALPE